MTPALSVCINHRARSYYRKDGAMFPLFRSAFDMLMLTLDAFGLAYEVIIADWITDDVDIGLGDWVDHPRVRTVSCLGEFTRGEGRQIAARAATGRVLYFMDADMLTPLAVLERGIDIVDSGKAFFPLYVRQAGHLSDRYVDGIGTGNAIVAREHHEQSTGYPSKTTWGGEDTAYWRWYVDRGLSVRERIPGYIHQWHPGEGPDLRGAPDAS